MSKASIASAFMCLLFDCLQHEEALSPIEHKIPVSTGFDFPVGDINAEGSYTNPIDGKTYNGWYVASEFLDANYYLKKGSYHPGADWNGSGGGDTDFGQPVYSISEGKVVRVCDGTKSGEELEKDYGIEVIIQHVLPDNRSIYSLYWHLETTGVIQNQIVARRQQIGAIGDGHGNYWAHLHLEIKTKLTPPYEDQNECYAWSGGDDYALTFIQTHYSDPSEFIRQHRIITRQ